MTDFECCVSSFRHLNLSADCKCYAAQVLLADIMTRLESMLRVLTDEGFSPLEHAYTDSWLHTGQQASAHGIAKASSRTFQALALKWDAQLRCQCHLAIALTQPCAMSHRSSCKRATRRQGLSQKSR